MMKNNIIIMYMLYFWIVCLLLVMDISILIYYIFWVTNIFFYPLMWIYIKILYYNRTILLLLLFYYFIAKYTIKEPGYKYFRFFKIDIKKWEWKFWNYIWNITTYHIELFSIFLFFIVITMPLLLYSKALFFLFCSFVIFIFSIIKILINRFKYIKEKKVRIRTCLIYIFLSIIFFKIINYQYIKDLYMMYIYLDKWAFELLEWKIQMYSKSIERDFFAETVGLKPIWVGEKYNKKNIIDFKLWDLLCKKKKKNIMRELKYELKRTKRKYYLYIKYYERVFDVKNGQKFKKIEKLRKDILLKNTLISSFKKKINNIEIKEWAPPIKIKNENPVVTQEKEKERLLHRVLISKIMHKFTINHYYRLNFLLKDLTLNKLYYQPFIDKKGIQKQAIEVKRSLLSINSKDRFNFKDDILFLKNIIKKIKQNQIFLNSIKKEKKDEANVNKYYFDSSIFLKIYNYLILEKKEKKKFNFLELEKKKINKKKEKFNLKKFLRDTTNSIKVKNEVNKLSYFNESKKSILNNDKLEEVKKKGFFSFSNYIEKKDLEKNDNQLLYKTVKKYNEKKTKLGWKHEFSDVYILKEKKNNLTMADSPDLSRRNKK